LKKLLAISLGFFIYSFAFAQEEEEHNVKVANKTLSDEHATPTCDKLMNVFEEGYMAGRVRYYFMNTNHLPHNESYFANAIGGALAYHTAVYKGFSAGLSGVFVYNVGSTEFHDSLISRNEVELFDVVHHNNKNDLDRLEELYLAYEWKNNKIKVGKQDITTPMVNMQDTRMKPYVFKGVWGKFQLAKNTKLDAGWFTEASPRSTVHWYGIDEAIGIYGQGYNTNGLESDYQGNIHSKGLGIVGLSNEFHNLKSQIWLYHINNILNLYFAQFDYETQIKNHTLVLGWQSLYENAHHNGGTSDLTHTYYYPNQQAFLNSVRVGLKGQNNMISFNTTHIANTGRYIFPREFGREQFYTTLPRGRVEGLGGATQMVLRFDVDKIKTEKFTGSAALGRTLTPNHFSYNLNKYQASDFDQFAGSLKFKPRKAKQGLSITALYIIQSSYHLADVKDLDVHHNFHQINLIANIKF